MDPSFVHTELHGIGIKRGVHCWAGTGKTQLAKAIGVSVIAAKKNGRGSTLRLIIEVHIFGLLKENCTDHNCNQSNHHGVPQT